MNESVLYLLPQGCQQADTEWPVLVFDAQGRALRVHLGALRPLLAGQPVLLVLPMEMFGSCEAAALPVRRPSREALAYALEEQLAAPLETLHLAYAKADACGRRRALAIERERLQAVLALLLAEGIDPVAVQVDADRLFAEPGALWLEGRWLLGGAGMALLAAPEPMAQALAPLLAPMPWLAEAPDTVQAPCNQAVQSAHARLLEGRPGAIDLRQGALRRRRRQWPWGQATAGLAMFWLLLCAADLLRAGWLQQRADQVQADNLHRFQRWAPGQPVTGELARLIDTLQQQPAPASAVQRLALLAEQLVESGNLHIERAGFGAAQGWQVEVKGQRFEDLERLRQRMPSLEVGHARQDGQGVRATLAWAGGH